MARAAWIAAALVLAGPATAQPRADIGGRWATEGFGSIVEFRPCATDPQTQCGRIVWLWAPTERGRARTDGHNPDPTARARGLLGVEIVQGLRQTAPGVWSGGRLYNPDDGRTYGGTVRLKGGVLQLEGCALKVVCRSQTWRRPQEVVAAAGGA